MDNVDGVRRVFTLVRSVLILVLRVVPLVVLLVSLGLVEGRCSRRSSWPETNGATRVSPQHDASVPGPSDSARSATVNGTAAAGAIVVLEPRTDRPYPPQAVPPVMDQAGQAFSPEVLFARTGQPVEFRNSDDNLHNVHVTNEETKEAAFNVAIPTGEKYTYSFQRDGFYHVGCDIHPEMSAEVLATSTPFATQAGEDGSFSFVDVPAGAYRIRVFSSRGWRQQDLEVRSGVNAVALTGSAGSR